MNWSNASLAQLYVIAFDDPVATELDRQLAAEEIAQRMKRKRKPYRNNQIKVKVVYPR